MNENTLTKSPAKILEFQQRHSDEDLLIRYAGVSDDVLLRSYHLDEDTVRRVKILRWIRNRLASATADRLTQERRDIVDELTKSPSESEFGCGMLTTSAYTLTKKVLNHLADIRSLDKAAHRMILDQRNQLAWEKAREKNDYKGMNDADSNYIKIHQLDTPDDVKLDPESIQIVNVMVTTKLSDVQPGMGQLPSVWESIAEAKKFLWLVLST